METLAQILDDAESIKQVESYGLMKELKNNTLRFYSENRPKADIRIKPHRDGFYLLSFFTPEKTSGKVIFETRNETKTVAYYHNGLHASILVKFIDVWPNTLFLAKFYNKMKIQLNGYSLEI